MLKYLITYLAAGLAFVAVDAVWLTLAGSRLYRPILGPILADRPAIAPAIAFYLIYIAGILTFAVLPSRDAGLGRAALTGAALGAMAYATYDLTNQATLKFWALRITLLDIGWGAIATALAAAAGLLAWRWAARAWSPDPSLALKGRDDRSPR